MPSVSPIAQHLRNNGVISCCPVNKPNMVHFINSEGRIVGQLKKEQDIDFSRIDVDIFNPNEKNPFMRMTTVIAKKVRYFLNEHRFMPVNITTTKILLDYRQNFYKKDEYGKGLRQNLYIEKLKESEELIKERKKQNLPDDFAIYQINKNFGYEPKFMFHYPKKAINTIK